MQMVLRASERGSSVAVEAALVLPVAMLFVGLVIVMAGHALAQQAEDAREQRHHGKNGRGATE